MNVFEVFAKLDLDSSGYKKKLENAKKLAVGFGKASAAVLGAGATAAGALTKKAVDAYSNFEQLKGGVETLFGAGGKSLKEYTASFDGTAQQAKASYNKLMKAQTIMLQNANNAYATAGISANEYMETVTSFSASLIQSLGGDTQKAAKYADMALVDMSDKMSVRVKRIELYQRCA